MFVCRKKAITFLEIIVAVAILSIAMIPLFALMSKETVETDKNASEAFAINKASEVLNSVLDNIPFAALRQGNPGYIKVDDLKEGFDTGKYSDTWAKNLSKMLFGNEGKESAGYPCRGIIKDARGIYYLVHMRVEDVTSKIKPPRPDKVRVGPAFPDDSPTSFSERNEMTFSFLKNPALISDGSWYVDYAENPKDPDKPLTELDLGSGRGVAEPSNNIYLDQGMEGYPPDAPRYLDPTAVRYTQKMISSKVPYDTSEQFAWCTMKKVLVQVQWNLDQKFFKTPGTDEGRVQRVHLMTLKGDID
ncbi:MAG: type IV pilus modification PilV family protein [Candidatus Rifleibacteriota bacterium]